MIPAAETTSRPQKLEIELEQTLEFLQLLEPQQDAFTFQTFPDSDALKQSGSLARVFHGTLAEHAPALVDLNRRGAGAFVMTNEGDGITREGKRTCRTKDNVIRVRALFVDLDGAPYQPTVEANYPASIIVETSPGRYHAYWPCIDCPLDAFGPAQIGLAHKFSGDDSVSDLPRVMRLPGFFHQKHEPFLTRLILPAR